MTIPFDILHTHINNEVESFVLSLHVSVGVSLGIYHVF